MVIGLTPSLLASVFSDANQEYQKGNYEEAVELWEKACDGGNMEGCFNLGYMYKNGKGVEKDKAKAVELYLKACNRKSMQGVYFSWMDV